MEKETLKKKILKILDGKNLAGLATVYEGKPWVRYVMVGNKDLDLYFATGLSTRKVKHIKENNNVHLTFGFNLLNPTGPYLQYGGKAEILTDETLKKEVWTEPLKAYFKGPDDPDYCIVKVTPEFIEYWSAELPDKFVVYKP